MNIIVTTVVLAIFFSIVVPQQLMAWMIVVKIWNERFDQKNYNKNIYVWVSICKMLWSWIQYDITLQLKNLPLIQYTRWNS